MGTFTRPVRITGMDGGRSLDGDKARPKGAALVI